MLLLKLSEKARTLQKTGKKCNNVWSWVEWNFNTQMLCKSCVFMASLWSSWPPDIRKNQPANWSKITRFILAVHSKMFHLGVKNTKICKQLFLLQMLPQSHLGVSHDHKLQNVHILGVKDVYLGWQKCQNLQKHYFAPSQLGSPMTKLAKFAYLEVKNAHFGCQKMPKFENISFGCISNSGVFHDQHLQNLHFWGQTLCPMLLPI